MENRIDFYRWLSAKLYSVNIGIYMTVGLVMLLPIFLAKMCAIQPIVASFITFFIISFGSRPSEH